jgi:hypothetical protein
VVVTYHDGNRRVWRQVPRHAEGRAVAIALMIGGIGLFGTFTGYLATWFMEPEARAVGSITHVTLPSCARYELKFNGCGTKLQPDALTANSRPCALTCRLQ